MAKQTVGNIVWMGDYVNGNIIESQTITNRQRQGGSSTTIYTGQPNQILAEYNLLTLSGFDCTVETGTTPWKLTAVLNRDIITNPVSDPAPQEEWFIRATPAQQNLLECTDRPTIALLTTQGKEAIESQLKNPTNNATTNYKGINQSAVISVYNLMRMGQDARQVFWPTLKRQITVSKGYNFGWSIANVGKVLSTTTLLSLYPALSYLASILPASNGLTTDINGVQTFGGWLEYYPTVDPVPTNKVQVATEFQFNSAWSAITYTQI